MKTYSRTVADQSLTTSDDDRTTESIINDEGECLDGNTVVTSGIEIDEFMDNGGPAPWSHQQDIPPLGKTLRIWKIGTQLRARTQFPAKGIYDLADTVWSLIKFGAVNSVSLSWVPLETKPQKNPDGSRGILFLRSKILEYSFVCVPANPRALITARAAGVNLAPIETWARGASVSARTAAQRKEAKTLAGMLAGQALKSSDPFAFDELLAEAKQESARLLAKHMVGAISRADFAAAAQAGLAEIAARASSRGLSRNQCAQVTAIYRVGLGGRLDAH